MTVARQIHQNNIVAGAGEVRLALRQADGTYDGERYVGDSTGLSLAVTRNVVDVQSGDGATPRTIEEIVTSTERTFSLTLHDVNADNIALFFQADIGQQDNANTAVVDAPLSVYPGRWYTLGQSANNPLGWGALTGTVSESGADKGDVTGALSITPAAGGAAVTVTVDPDYVAAEEVAGKVRDTKDILVDLERGAIYISPYGDLKAAGPHKLEVDYTPAEPASPKPKRRTFRSTTKSQQGALRYTEQSQTGVTGHDIYARLCSITANGELPLKDRSAAQQFGLSLKVLVPDDNYPAIAGIESMGPDSG